MKTKQKNKKKNRPRVIKRRDAIYLAKIEKVSQKDFYDQIAWLKEQVESNKKHTGGRYKSFRRLAIAKMRRPITLQLKMRGNTYHEIAKLLGISATQAHKDVTKELNRVQIKDDKYIYHIVKYT